MIRITAKRDPSTAGETVSVEVVFTKPDCKDLYTLTS